jgi:uncharacterized protein YecT (DUF1311 family)
MKIFALAAGGLLFAALPAHAGDAPLYKAKDCGKYQVQADMNQCAGDNYQAADDALNAVYKSLMAQQDDAPSRAALRDAERAWITYRDKECAFEIGPQENGGSIWPMEMSNCLEDKTAARITELKGTGPCTAGVSACYHH